MTIRYRVDSAVRPVGWAAFVAAALMAGALACRRGAPGASESGVREPVVGVSLRVPSSVYGAEQRISVYLPGDYDAGAQRYPVVFATHSRYLHLAGALEDLSRTQIPPSILVYLEDYDSGDFLPTAIPSRPGSGEAEKLVRFFSTELIPFIDARFRTQPFRVFHSGSWGGVFCLYALLSRPDVFQGCIAATPWVIYDDDQRHLVRSAGALLRSGRFSGNFLFIALGNDPDPGLRSSVEAIADTVRTVAPDGLSFEYRYLPDEDHYSVGHKAFFDGLRWIFGGWRDVPVAVLDGGRDSLAAHRARMRERYGYDIGLHWSAAYSRGFAILGRGDPAQARQMFTLCSDLAPSVPACVSGLGRTYEAEGDSLEARRAYERALDLAIRGGYPDLGTYRDAVQRVGARARR